MSIYQKKTKPTAGDVIVVWFSCGAASAIAAKETLRKYGNECLVRIVNNPVKEEDDDNRRFLKDVEQWLGVEIETAVNPNYPDASIVEVFEKRKYMSGVAGAPCTYELKKQARAHWEKENKFDWLVLGFTAEEENRFNRFKMTERENILPVLIESGITKSDCFMQLMDAGIPLPKIYHRGYPNANCIGCVKSTSPTYWNLVRKEDPEVFEERANQSREIGCKLVRHNGKRIFLDELPADAQGAPLKDLSFECGIFCEETGGDNETHD